MKTYLIDVALFSETWLRDQKELLDYMSIDGYATEFLRCVATKGGEVGAYINCFLMMETCFWPLI